MVTPLSMPVRRAQIMEDRAQIERYGDLVLAGGAQTFEVRDLSLWAVNRSLKVEVVGATLLDAALRRRVKPKPKGGLAPDASDLRRRARALTEEAELRTDDVVRLETKTEILSRARRDLLRSIAQGAGAGASSPTRWAESLHLLDTQQHSAALALRDAREGLAQAQKERDEAAFALSHAEARDEDLECSLVFTVDGTPNASAIVSASYLVPSAVWRPAYRASLSGQRVLLEADAVVWQNTGERWDEVELSFSTARPALGTSPPRLTADRLTTRAKQAEEKRVIDITVREERIPSAGETSPLPPEVPGLDDGGETRILTAPNRHSLPSDGQPHRVPLFSFEAPADLECVCAAELSPLASTLARFANLSGQVLLAGPVDSVRHAGFVGRSQLRFAAPGERICVSFGSDDGLRVVRNVEERQEEARLTGRRTTTRSVHLHVSNASDVPAAVTIEERVPVSEVAEVEVRVLKKACAPTSPELSAEGIARIQVALPANGTRTLTFAWELSVAAKLTGV